MRMCEFQLPVGMHLFYKFPTALDLLKCSKPCSLVFHPLLPTLKTKKKNCENCENLFPRFLFFSAPNDPCRVGGKLPKLASCIKAKRKILNITAANL